MGHSAVIWDQKLAVEVTKDWNGTDQVLLRVPQGASVRVGLHGGQVVSWRNERGKELLFTSSKAKSAQAKSAQANFKPLKGIRGVIPIFFPLFRDTGSLEQHGFARNKIWRLDDNPPPLHPNDDKGKVSVDLVLRPSEEDLKFWPWCFESRLRVSLATDGSLSLVARIRNLNRKPLSFSFAYHTHLSVSDIRPEQRRPWIGVSMFDEEGGEMDIFSRFVFDIVIHREKLWVASDKGLYVGNVGVWPPVGLRRSASQLPTCPTWRQTFLGESEGRLLAITKHQEEKYVEFMKVSFCVWELREGEFVRWSDLYGGALLLSKRWLVLVEKHELGSSLMPDCIYYELGIYRCHDSDREGEFTYAECTSKKRFLFHYLLD